MIARATVGRIRASRGRGSGSGGTGGACGHQLWLVRGVPNLHRFHQKVLKMEQKGGTPYFDHFWGRFHPPWYPPPSPELPDSENGTAFPFPVPFSALRDEISGWGVQRG